MANPPGEIVWQRRVDEEKHRRNLRLFWMFYGMPVGLTILIGGVFFGGVGTAAGLAILLGGIGSMIFVAIWLKGYSIRANPVITRHGAELCWAKRRVPIDQVQHLTTFTENLSVSQSAITGSHITNYVGIGTARFILSDGREVDFVFPHLDTAQLDEMRVALEYVLPGKWISVGDLYNTA